MQKGNICYTDKFLLGHKFTRRQVYLIEIDNTSDDERGSQATTEDSILIEELTINEPNISIHALPGVHSFSTMKVVISMETHQLHILINSGSMNKNLRTN